MSFDWKFILWFNFWYLFWKHIFYILISNENRRKMKMQKNVTSIRQKEKSTFCFIKNLCLCCHIVRWKVRMHFELIKCIVEPAIYHSSGCVWAMMWWYCLVIGHFIIWSSEFWMWISELFFFVCLDPNGRSANILFDIFNENKTK